jgi:hypothetical protein
VNDNASASYPPPIEVLVGHAGLEMFLRFGSKIPRQKGREASTGRSSESVAPWFSMNDLLRTSTLCFFPILPKPETDFPEIRKIILSLVRLLGFSKRFGTIYPRFGKKIIFCFHGTPFAVSTGKKAGELVIDPIRVDEAVAAGLLPALTFA